MSKRYDDWELKNDSYFDEDKRNDEEPALSEEDLEYKIMDEDMNATLHMYGVLKEYLENQSLPYPFMDKFNQMNFMIWFSEHLGNKLLRYE
jgi:hypothetical protein